VARLKDMNQQNIYIEWLVLKIQGGDEQALNDLLDAIRHRLLTYARRLLSDPADADDCVQDALVVICKKLHQLREPKAFHGWMYRVINSRCQDFWRRQRPAESLEKHVIPTADTTERTADVSDMAGAIGQLAVGEAAVMHLFYFAGFTVAEISQILDKPAGTIKSMLFQARAHIKSLLT
jgi:RNA polymerase sigma factor (sigma-70 family)